MKKVLSIALLSAFCFSNIYANEEVILDHKPMFEKEVSNENIKIDDLKENKMKEMKKEKLEEAKERAINKISERIEILEKAKKCISVSKSKEDLEECRPHKKDKMNEERERG